MSILIVTLPNATQVALPVAEETLVYDGINYVEPKDAKYVMLFSVPVDSVVSFKSVAESIRTYGYVLASVVSYNPIVQATTDASALAEVDPSGGECICFVTCKGTWLQYVTVVNA